MRKCSKAANLISSVRPRHFFLVLLCWELLFSRPGWTQALNDDGARTPLGVYVHLDIDSAIQRFLHDRYPDQSLDPCYGLPEGLAAAVHTHLRALYSSLLTGSAVSGITAGAHWCLIQRYDPTCKDNSCNGLPDGNDWSYLNDIFDSLGPDQTVQLIVTPGVDTPPWLMNKLTSCDGLFPVPQHGTAEANHDCGKVTFTVLPEQSHGEGNQFPMPWNAAYISYWKRFLGDLRDQYKDRKQFVSIAVAGPNGASTEMILPTSANLSYLFVSYTVQPPPVLRVYIYKYPADTMWQILIANALKGSDLKTFLNYREYEDHPEQVFVDAWNMSIDTYQQIFSGITLFLSADSGTDIDLPLIGSLAPPDQALDQDDRQVYETLEPKDCATWAATEPVPCRAKVEVLSHFVNSKTSIGIPNQKSTQVGGMTARSPISTGNIDVPGVKLLTSWLKSALNDPPPGLPFLGGAEFDYPVSDSSTTQQEGCARKLVCDTPEEAAYNVLSTYFSCTNYDSRFAADADCTDSTLTGARPVKIQYVDLYYGDIQYAQEHSCPSESFKSTSAPPWSSCTSLQDLLNWTQYDLKAMAGKQPKSRPTATCQSSSAPCW